MNSIMEEKPLINGQVSKPKKWSSVEQALAQLETLAFEEPHESWWSILRYWIRELRWRRIFWGKMGRHIEQEQES